MLVLAKHVAAPALTLQAWIDISFLISLIHGKKHLLAFNFESWSRVMFQENSLSAMFTSFQRQLAWQASQTGEDGYKITDETNNSGCSSCCMLWQFQPHKDVQCHLKTSALFFLFSFLFLFLLLQQTSTYAVASLPRLAFVLSGLWGFPYYLALMTIFMKKYFSSLGY